MHDLFSTLTPSAQLTREEFHARFDVAWAHLSSRFFKFECQQSYDEGPDSAFHAFVRHDLNVFVEKAVRTGRAVGEYLKTPKERGATFLRIHAVSTPLTEYLTYELHAYVVNEYFGEQVFLIDVDEAERIVGGPLKDFQLFDADVLFVQDVLNGVNVGVTESRNPVDIARAVDVIERLRRASRSFRTNSGLDPQLVARLEGTCRS